MNWSKALDGTITITFACGFLVYEGLKTATKGGEVLVNKAMAQPKVQSAMNWAKEKSEFVCDRGMQELEKHPTLKRYLDYAIDKGEVVLKFKDQKEAIAFLKDVEKEYNGMVQKIGEESCELYGIRKQSVQLIAAFENYLNGLSNKPIEFERVLQSVKSDLKEINEAIRLEEENYSANIKGAGMGAVGTAAGAAVAVAGSTALLAAATAFGTASTGVAISTLSGAAATNAALAWLGGGTLATGGGGISAGNALIGLAGPVGWTIAGAAAIGAGLLTAKRNSAAARKAKSQAEVIKIRTRLLSKKCDELRALSRQTRNLKDKISAAFIKLERISTKNHQNFTDDEKVLLGCTVNDVQSLGKLINTHISLE